MSHDETKAYWTALGHFIDQYAQTEKLLAMCLWQLAGVPIEKARALFHGVRTDAATSYITRIVTATKVSRETSDEYSYLFSHLGHITKLRNSILHYGTEFNEGVRQTTNRFIALTPDRIEERPATAEILYAAGRDLQRINWRLAAEMSRGNEAQGAPARSFFTDVVNWSEPWHYTPPQQASRRDSSRATTLTQQSQPQSSAE
jgi:hypothetical protein